MTGVAAIVLGIWLVLSLLVSVGLGRVFRSSSIENPSVRNQASVRPLDEADPSGLAHR